MAVTADYLTDLEDVLRRHLPRDSDPNMTDHVVHQWKSQMESASEVQVDWIEHHGRKLRASWSNGEAVLVSIARPLPKAESLWKFVHEWEACRLHHGLPAIVKTAADSEG